MHNCIFISWFVHVKRRRNKIHEIYFKFDDIMFRVIEAVTQRCSVRKGVLRNFAKFTGKPQFQSLFFNEVADHLIKRETLAKVFSCEFCEVSNNTFSYRTHLVAAIMQSKAEWDNVKQKKLTYFFTVIRRCILCKLFISYYHFYINKVFWRKGFWHNRLWTQWL